MSRKILVPVDSSEHSKDAFEWTLSNIAQKGDTVILVHVKAQVVPASVSLLAPLGPGFVNSDVVIEAVKKVDEAANELVTNLADEVKSKGFGALPLVVAGDAKDEICRAAADNDVDMVIMGSRGLGAVKRAFMGSVSHYVVQHAGCPVIISRPKGH